MRELTFCAAGPAPTQGSMNAYARGGRVAVVHSRDREIQGWRMVVAAAARAALRSQSLSTTGLAFPGSVDVALTFTFAVPASYVSASGRLKGERFPRWDIDKLCRAALDALTCAGCVWADDSRVVELSARKAWESGSGPGLTRFRITEHAAAQLRLGSGA